MWLDFSMSYLHGEASCALILSTELMLFLEGFIALAAKTKLLTITDLMCKSSYKRFQQICRPDHPLNQGFTDMIFLLYCAVLDKISTDGECRGVPRR